MVRGTTAPALPNMTVRIIMRRSSSAAPCIDPPLEGARPRRRHPLRSVATLECTRTLRRVRLSLRSLPFHLTATPTSTVPVAVLAELMGATGRHVEVTMTIPVRRHGAPTSCIL